MEAEISVLWSQVKAASNHQKLEEARNGTSPRASGGRDFP